MIAGIHGIGYQRLTSTTEQPKWRGALAHGLENASVDVSLAEQLLFVGYGDLFLPKGTLASADPNYDASDLDPGFETELLQLWFEEARLRDPNLPKPEDPTRLPAIPRSVQRMLDALSQSKTFAGLSERALIYNLKQVRRYMSEPLTRAAIQERISQTIPPGTKLVIAHSLGTVVAYEAICAHPEWKIEGFVTMGSPLGIRNLIFERLVPGAMDGVGVWPEHLGWWVNVADETDVVAIEKRLANCFGSRVEDWVVDNGFAEVHGAEKYLAQAAVGAALRRIKDQEVEGLDPGMHGEQRYNLEG
jgi:hypothetical protein